MAVATSAVVAGTVDLDKATVVVVAETMAPEMADPAEVEVVQVAVAQVAAVQVAAVQVEAAQEDLAVAEEVPEAVTAAVAATSLG